MSGYSEAALEKKLAELNGSAQSIQQLSLWLIHHRKHCDSVAKVWARELAKTTSKGPSGGHHFSRKLTFLYLANDVVQNSKKRHPEYIRAFGDSGVLKGALQNLASASDPGIDPKTVKAVARLLAIWQDRSIFDRNVQTELARIWTAKTLEIAASTSTAASTSGSEPSVVEPSSSPPAKSKFDASDPGSSKEDKAATGKHPKRSSSSSSSSAQRIEPSSSSSSIVSPAKKIRHDSPGLSSSSTRRASSTTSSSTTTARTGSGRKQENGQASSSSSSSEAAATTGGGAKKSGSSPSNEAESAIVSGAADPPEPEELIKALQELENSASSDAVVREKIARLPPEVSETSHLDKVQSVDEGRRLLAKVSQAMTLLNDYNGRLQQELKDRRRVEKMVGDFLIAQKDLLSQAEERLELYRDKLDKVNSFRDELKAHIQSLPDLTQLPDVTGGLAPLPSAGDLFTIR